jgi:predicted Mrr-cat superfamily restriction endonuclease
VRREKAPFYAAMLYRFANELDVGDIIVTPYTETRELLFGEITGPYKYPARARRKAEPSCSSRDRYWLAALQGLSG